MAPKQQTQATNPSPEYEGCVIVNVRRGKKSQGRDHIIYARLENQKGELLISADLDYIVAALKDRLPSED